VVVPVEVGETRRDRYGIIGVGPLTEMSIAKVEAGGAAERAGIRAGDVMEPGPYASFIEGLTAWGGGTIGIEVTRGEERLTVDLLPMDREGRPDPGLAVTYPSILRQYGPASAMVESLKHNWNQTGALFSVLKKLVSRELSPMTLSGPIEIFRLAGESLSLGWTYYLTLMSFISLQLGIINLLPIPIMDGGHIFILFVEGIMRRDLSMRIKERVMQFGFILLLLLMGTVIYIDLYKNLFID
jgi:regulator of sigma E protease